MTEKEALQEPKDGIPFEVEPSRALALRFAKGEISHEAFDHSMELLRKPKVVK